MIPGWKIEACIKAFYGCNDDTTYGKIQAVLMAYEHMCDAPNSPPIYTVPMHMTPGTTPQPAQVEAVEREDDYIVPKSVYEEMLAALADREAIGFISEESLSVLLYKDGYQKWVEICNTNSGEGKPRIPLYRVPTAHGANRIEVDVSGTGVLAVMDRAHMELLISDRLDEAAEIGLAREAISSLLCLSKSFAEVYDAMGSPRGPSRIMLDAAIARCKGTPAQADTTPAAHGVGDRAALEYLMQQFDAETWECRICGHSEPTNDCDSAIYLREYLQAASAPGGES